MVTSKISQLAAARAKVARLESAIESELHRELSVLHERFGFADLKSFFNAVQSAAATSQKAGRPKKAAPAARHRKRAVITAAMREKVVKLAKAGTTASKIAQKIGISLPSVQNIKKAAGLVHAHGAKPSKPAKKISAKKRSTRKSSPEKTETPQAVPGASKPE
jgi:hypothetical protein